MNVLLAPSDASWVAVAVAAVWKSLVVLICAGMIVMALRRSSAATRILQSGGSRHGGHPGVAVVDGGATVLVMGDPPGRFCREPAGGAASP